MASISALTFTDPRIRFQSNNATNIDFVAHGKEERCSYLLMTSRNLPPAAIKNIEDVAGNVINQIPLPKKMVAALHRAAVLKGYLHYGGRI